MQVVTKVRLFRSPYTIFFISEDVSRLPDEQSYKSIGVKTGDCCEFEIDADEMKKKLKLRVNALFLQPFVKECVNSDVYRSNVVSNLNRLGGNPKCGTVFLNLILEPPDTEIIDYAWNERILKLVWTRVEIENAFSWLSTLGGAYSALGDYFEHCGKLVIGHNMLLDILHTLGHFFQQPPCDYLSFKEFAHCMFPKLLDTKYMSSAAPFKDKLSSSVLKDLLSCLSFKPFSVPKVGSLEGRGYSHLDDKQHEAGYDAYITGLCFLAMHAHICRANKPIRVEVTLPALKPYLNKLFLAKTARQDSPFINLDGADPTPSRDHVFHMVFPKEWQRSDINQLFSPFGAITVQFLDETSAYVALDRREQAADVTRILSGNTLVKLTPYAQYRNTKDHQMATHRRDRPKSDTYKLMFVFVLMSFLALLAYHFSSYVGFSIRNNTVEVFIKPLIHKEDL